MATISGGHGARDEIQRSRALDRLVKTVTAGLPRDKVIVGFGAAGAGWHKSCISRRMGPIKEFRELLSSTA